MNNKKVKYGHVGRPTNEELNKNKKKRNLKIIGIMIFCILLIGGIFLYLNKDNISFESIMGNSTYSSTMKDVQNSSKYKRITYTPEKYKSGNYYQTYASDKKTKFVSYLFSQTGHSSSRYSWIKIQIFSDGKYLKSIKPTASSLKISKKYAGKTLGLKVFVKSKATGNKYVKYLRLYITDGGLNQNSSCTYVPNNNQNKFLWPIGAGKDGKPQTINISSGYSNRKVNGSIGMHYGIDISKGNNPTIIAVYDGKVTKVVNSSKNTYKSKKADYGTYVILEHNYNGTKLYSIYAHMVYNSIPKNIVVGSKVKAGTKLGIMGNTGYSSGTHLHFEMRKNDTKVETRAKNNVNPLNYVNPNNPYPSGKWNCK